MRHQARNPIITSNLTIRRIVRSLVIDLKLSKPGDSFHQGVVAVVVVVLVHLLSPNINDNYCLKGPINQEKQSDLCHITNIL